MERNFTNENFERFLRQNADGLRMRPSSKVWNGINKHLNRRKRRTLFLLGFALLLTSSAGYYLIETQENQPGSIASGKQAASQKPIPGAQDKDLTLTTHEDSGNELSEKPTARIINMSERERNEDQTSSLNIITSSPSVPESPVYSENLIAENINFFEGTVVDEFQPHTGDAEPQLMKEAEKTNQFPYTIESVVNAYQLRKRKLDWQFFFTPTISYRRLTENKAYSVSKGGATAQLGVYNINNAVIHKPDFGFQIGLLAKYPLGRNFKLRGGVQFNVNRYDIKTFNSGYEVATIQFRGTDTLRALTAYNNFSGYKSDWLENFYFQLALPVGVEMKVSGNEKTSLGVAATIQPTYLLGDKAYLISRDYKAYMEVPWLVRKWNVNAGIETFVNYSTGKMQWQVGPQVRYQLLSSYDKKYPIKEHLFDFGLKVGVSLNNK